MALSHWGTVFALLNGMLGGTLLVLPLLGIESGWVMIPLVAAVYGLISYFSAYLIVLHLGDAPNINEAILDHFKGDFKYSVLYNIFVGFSLFGFLLSYYPLIIKQLEGIFHPHPIIPPLVAVMMIVNVIILRKFHFAEKLLSIGCVGLLLYIFFLVWAQVTAPPGPHRVPAADHEWVNLSAALVMGYAIHDFIVQVLIKNPDRADYPRIVFHTYILGMVIYTFISYGCYAIVNRKPRIDEPETISEYFPYGSWQVIVIEVMYLINLLTMSPEFMIIFKIRYLQICKYEEPEHIEKKEVVFYIGTILICYLIYALDIKIATIIELNGSIIGFSYIFVIPIWVHLKCVYYDKNCGGIMTPEQVEEEDRLKKINAEKRRNGDFDVESSSSSSRSNRCGLCEGSDSSQSDRNPQPIQHGSSLTPSPHQPIHNLRPPSIYQPQQYPYQQNVHGYHPQHGHGFNQPSNEYPVSPYIPVSNNQLPPEQIVNGQREYQARMPRCNHKYRSKMHKRLELLLIIMILIIGFVSMCYTMYLMFFAEETESSLTDTQNDAPKEKIPGTNQEATTTDTFYPFTTPVENLNDDIHDNGL